MLASLVAIEQRKILQRRVLWVELAVVVGLLALVLCVRFLMVRSGGAAQAGGAIPTMDTTEALMTVLQLAVNSQVGGLLAIILVGAVVAQEYTWRTLHMTLSRGVPRPTLLAAKFAAFLPAAALYVLVSLGAGVAIAGLLLVITRVGVDLSQVRFDRLAFAVAFGAYGLLPYAALAFVLAVLSRSTVTAIGGGIGIALLENVSFQLLSSLGGTTAQLANWLPSSFATTTASIVQSVSGAGIGANVVRVAAPLSPDLAALGIAAYTLVFISVAGMAFVRQDLTG